MRFKAFEEFFEIPLRNGLTKPKRVRGEGYKMVNMGELFKYPRINNIPMDRVPLNDKELASSMLQSGDLLFARQSLVLEGAGQCSIFVDDDEEACFESHLIRCRLNKDIANPLFYYYFFSSQIGKQTIGTIVEQGAGASGIRGSDLAKVLVPELDIEAQDAIAFILDQIDSKIELNQQINQTLEQIAQAIFKSWFVDFEPVKAKIAALEAGGSEDDALLTAMQAISGKDPQQLTQLQTENPEHYATLRATAELFPAAMQESELGEIPEGWVVSTLSDFCEFQNGYAFKGKDWADSGFPVVKIGSVKPGFVDLTKASYVSSKTVHGLERFELKAGDILVGMTGYPGETGLVPNYPNRVFLNQRVGRFIPNEDYLYGYIFSAVRGLEFKTFVESQAHGSAQANVSGKAILKYPLISGSKSLMTQFHEIVNPQIQQMICLNAECSQLAELRDTLLPKLLSGELNVNQDAD